MFNKTELQILEVALKAIDPFGVFTEGVKQKIVEIQKSGNSDETNIVE